MPLWCQRITPSQWSSSMSQKTPSGASSLSRASAIQRRRNSSAVSGVLELVEAVEPLGEHVRADGVQRLREQLVEQVALATGQVLRPLQPHVAGALQQLLVVL
jgi:hypothetical protein